jgi:hypothetical protein
VRNGGEVRDGVRSDPVNRALNRLRIEQVADMVLDACNRRERYAGVESEHRVTAPREQLREMKPDETSVSSDENSQQRLPAKSHEHHTARRSAMFLFVHAVILRCRRGTVLRLARSAVAQVYLAVLGAPLN